MSAVYLRHLPGAMSNRNLNEYGPTGAPAGNAAWIKSAGGGDGIVLLGGCRIPHFRMRVAQSHLRSDLAPSFWSMSGIALDAERFVSIPIDTMPREPSIPEANGIQVCRWADYNDASEYPNVALVRFGVDSKGLGGLIAGPAQAKPSTKPRKSGEAKPSESEPPSVEGVIKELAKQRATLQFPDLLWAWLGYAWGVPGGNNPLLAGK